MSKPKGFEKNFRIRQKILFDLVLDQRKKLLGKYCLFYYKKNNLSFSRLGILVSKKKLPLAVERNRFKRITREVFRLSQQKLRNLDIVVISKPEAKNTSQQELRQCLENLFSQLIVQ